MPIPGGTLGGEPQRLRASSHDGGVWVGVDAFGEGGAQVVKQRVDTANGVLFGIDDVLDVPPDLAQVIADQNSVSYFSKILNPEITQLLNQSSGLTLFIPVDNAWKVLDPLERLYLESDFATDDLTKILNLHAIARHGVKWSDSFEPAVNLTTIDGNSLEIVVQDDKTMVSSAKLVQPDIYASNGVLHLVDSLLLPPGALQLTPEKYLLALNCSSFVSLIHSVDLTSLINNTESKHTILAIPDDVLSAFGDNGLPEKGSEELKQLLKYHFIPGRWTPKKLEDGMLLETELTEDGLDGGHQVLGVDVSSTSKKPDDRSIQFGGAGIIGDHIEVNHTVIYFISRPLTRPADALQTALPSLELSSFLAAVFSTSLGDIIKKTPRTTLLFPHNSAFKRLGLLVSAHLLSSTSQDDLRNVVLHHAIDGVEYTQSLRNGLQHTFRTIEGSDVQIERPPNGTLLLKASGGWAGMQAEILPQNMLTQTGVLHEVSDLVIPRSVHLTVGKLVKAAKGTTMATLVNKAGMDWVLNGTAPPEGSPWAEAGYKGAGWTLLCPPDDAFKQYNLTQIYQDKIGLQYLVSQHLIPTRNSQKNPSAMAIDVLNNNRPLPLADSLTYSTLLSPLSSYGDIVFKELTGDKVSEFVVGISGARGANGRDDFARVLAWGRSTTGGGTGGVIQIDRLLVPYQPGWLIEYGGPAFVGVGGILLICAFFYGVRKVWQRDVTEATYEPVGGFSRTDGDED
jgi:solute carrier family 25 carnitine/acylcarnitine transporter 20/29